MKTGADNFMIMQSYLSLATIIFLFPQLQLKISIAGVFACWHQSSLHSRSSQSSTWFCSGSFYFNLQKNAFIKENKKATPELAKLQQTCYKANSFHIMQLGMQNEHRQTSSRKLTELFTDKQNAQDSIIMLQLPDEFCSRQTSSRYPMVRCPSLLFQSKVRIQKTFPRNVLQSAE